MEGHRFNLEILGQWLAYNEKEISLCKNRGTSSFKWKWCSPIWRKESWRMPWSLKGLHLWKICWNQGSLMLNFHIKTMILMMYLHTITNICKKLNLTHLKKHKNLLSLKFVAVRLKVPNLHLYLLTLLTFPTFSV